MLRATALLLAAGLASPVLAAPPVTDHMLWESRGFLAAHPDVKYRKLGLDLLDHRRSREAAQAFLEAARYGDKASQAMLGEMHWTGAGAPLDRPRAYAWMDLAAERGYRLFLGKRERYWRELDESERAAALEIGAALYAEYGDDIARPRLDQALLYARRGATGSRLGAVGRLKVQVPTAAGWIAVDGSRYYAKRYWDPVLYAQFTDAVWTPMPKERVYVGPMRDEGERHGRGGGGGGA
jgi:uncharacterized protein